MAETEKKPLEKMTRDEVKSEFVIEIAKRYELEKRLNEKKLEQAKAINDLKLLECREQVLRDNILRKTGLSYEDFALFLKNENISIEQFVKIGLPVKELTDVVKKWNTTIQQLIKTGLTGEQFVKQQQQQLQQEIASKTVSVGNLMFQNTELPNKMNWQSACDYCEKLRLFGFSNWRLPNIDELKTAYNNKSKFKNIGSWWYWSISKYDSSSSLVVYLNSGGDDWYYQATNGLVLCVRDTN